LIPPSIFCLDFRLLIPPSVFSVWIFDSWFPHRFSLSRFSTYDSRIGFLCLEFRLMIPPSVFSVWIFDSWFPHRFSV
jgi:low temperature requirement protein LtrA